MGISYVGSMARKLKRGLAGRQIGKKEFKKKLVALMKLYRGPALPDIVGEQKCAKWLEEEEAIISSIRNGILKADFEKRDLANKEWDE